MVYVLELSRPLAGRAKYYIGWSKNLQTLDRRIKHHQRGTSGCAFTRAAIEQGIELKPIIVLDGERDLEPKLKNWKSGERVARRYINSQENLINK